LVAYGIALMDKGEFASAIDYFRRAQQLTPQNYVLFINLAIAENETNQSAAAEQHFKEALRLAPWLCQQLHLLCALLAFALARR